MNEISAKQLKAVEELMGLEKLLCEMFQKGQVDEALDYLIDDALVCPPEMQAIRGRENQKAMFKQFLDIPGVELSWEPIEARVSSSCDLGYVYGTVDWKLPDSDTVNGKYISVWMKEDGQWRNAVEIRNSNS